MVVGEALEHLTGLDPNEPLTVHILGDEYEVSAIDGTEIQTLDGDDDPAQAAYDVLEELRDFKGTKKDMLKLVSDYFGE